MISQLLENCNFKKPHNSINKHGITYIIRINDNEIDSRHIVALQEYFSYIANQYDLNQLDSYNKISVRVQIQSKYFKDKSVVIFIESLLYALLHKRKIYFYLHICGLNVEIFEYNFFRYSMLSTVVRKNLYSEEYCKQFEKTMVKPHNLRYFINADKTEKNMSFVSKIETDISIVLKHILKSSTVNDICSIVGELVDNVKAHTNGQGILDFSFELLKHADDDGRYYQFTINVINFSKNQLYTKLENGYYQKTLDDRTMSIINQAYTSQKEFFSDEDYSSQLFFMVSSFQRGTTTRKSLGGTGLNNTLRNLSKKSMTNVRDDLSYVYSGKNVLKFDLELLKKENIGDSIAFNEHNNFLKRPDSKCLSYSLFDFKGTAYNLMFIVKEDNL